MSLHQKRRFILKSLNEHRNKIIRQDIITYKVVTKYFTAVVVSGNRYNKIETIYQVEEDRPIYKSLTYNLKQLPDFKI
ncbi:MAG: hypothetical protein ACOCRK_11265 [bacterium]